MSDQELCRIEDYAFGYEDHGILTFGLELHFNNSTYQHFGGYSLDSFDKDEDRRIGTAAGLDYIIRVMQCFDVRNLDQLKGKMCFGIRAENSERFVGVKQIPQDGDGKFLIKDWQEKWFPGEEDKF